MRSLVFFYLDFDEKGQADTGWNMPCATWPSAPDAAPTWAPGRSAWPAAARCPVSWHQMHMWDPNLAPGNNDLALVRDTVKRNGLGLMVEDDLPQAVEPERLQMAPEDKWYAPPDASAEVAEQLAQKLEQEHRLKTAQLIKQQRLRIASLGQQNEEALAKYRLAAEEQIRGLQGQIQALQQNVRQQEELNADLKRQLLTQTEGFQKSREEMSQQLRAGAPRSHRGGHPALAVRKRDAGQDRRRGHGLQGADRHP